MYCFQYEHFQQYYTSKIPQWTNKRENVPFVHFKVSLKKPHTQYPQEPFAGSNLLHGKQVMGLDHYQSFIH